MPVELVEITGKSLSFIKTGVKNMDVFTGVEAVVLPWN